MVTAEIYLIKKEARPAAEITIRNKTLSDAETMIEQADLKMFKTPCGENHHSLFIYKHAHLEPIIKKAVGLPTDEMALQRWIEGKLFGYSEEMIGEFIESEKNRESA